MTTSTSRLLHQAATAGVPIVQGIDESQFDRGTPCAEFTVRELINHLFHVIIGFQSLAVKQTFDFSTTPGYVRAGDWRARFEHETAILVKAWAEPSALDGVSPGMGLPQETVGALAVLDLTIHVWDLARATDREYEAAPEITARLSALAEQMGPTARQWKILADVVPVPPTASPFERLLGLTGRDPWWRGRS
ncbi:TIGR03086 family metal-binding protein [Allorhizocola rhizosphaerae]|uniref:TIGR03086 family metal-binding protein n=1 Tax=Allorhizocola rhizosphaerae TaxID=1872709 RepID=UPI000E3EB7D3|nr:TIGR03086 family metal-binding protein [Allorhizocola rhizosphaerae]